MRRFCPIFSCIFLFACGVSVFGQTSPPEKWTNRVELRVSSDDGIKEEVNSYIMQGLRSLGDVESVNTEPDLRIRVLAVKLTSVSRISNGYAISVLITRPVDLWVFKNRYPTLDPTAIKFLDGIANRSEFIEGQFVRTGGSKDLEKLCRQIVANIDTDYLEPARKAWSETKRILEKQEVSPNK